MRHLSCTAYLIALGLMMPVGGRARQNESETPTRARIHEAMFVPLGGMEQWITIRGDDVRNPVILMLHGGPGFPTSELAPAFAPLESRYTLVQWDQPGGGATYAKNIEVRGGHQVLERGPLIDLGVLQTPEAIVKALRLIGTELGVHVTGRSRQEGTRRPRVCGAPAARYKLGRRSGTAPVSVKRLAATDRITIKLHATSDSILPCPTLYQDVFNYT